MTEDEIAALGTNDFVFRLRGLSARSAFAAAVRHDGPAELDESQAARALGLPRRRKKEPR